MKVATTLNSKQTLQKVQDEFRRLEGIGFEEIPKGLELIYSLDQKMKTEQISDEELRVRYDVIMRYLKTVYFSNFTEKEVLSFLKYYFVSAVALDAKGFVSLFGNLRAYLMDTNLFDRNQVLGRMRRALSECVEQIGSEPINLRGGKQKPTFSNWVKDYVRVVGAGKKTLNTVGRYLVQSENARNLSQSNKKILSRCLRYYELLKLKTNELGSPANYTVDYWGIDNWESIDDDIFRVQNPEPGLAVQFEDFPDDEVSFILQQSFAIMRSLSPKAKKPSSAKKESRAAINSNKQRVAPVKKASSQRKPRSLEEQAGQLSKQSERSVSSLPERPVAKRPEQDVATVSALSLDTLPAFDIVAYRNLAQSESERKSALLSLLVAIQKQHGKQTVKAAWQQSKLYALYSHIGRMSMSSQKSVVEVANELKETGKGYLTEEEFATIADINSRL